MTTPVAWTRGGDSGAGSVVNQEMNGPIGPAPINSTDGFNRLAQCLRRLGFAKGLSVAGTAAPFRLWNLSMYRTLKKGGTRRRLATCEISQPPPLFGVVDYLLRQPCSCGDDWRGLLAIRRTLIQVRESRCMPLSWPTDSHLVKGAFNRSAAGTLAERSIRSLLLVHIPDAKAVSRQSASAGVYNGLRRPYAYPFAA